MITIFGYGLSAPANKVRMCAHALGIDHKYEEVDLFKGQQKSAGYLKVNPIGKVPALSEGDFNMFESDAIVRYLAQIKESPLYPSDLKTRAVIDQWMSFASLHLMSSVAKIMFNTHFYKVIGAEKDERSLSEGKQFLGNYLNVLNKELQSKDWLVENKESLADICCIAALDPLDVLDFDLAEFEKVTALRETIRKKDYYKKVHNSFGETFENLTRP